MRTSPHAELSSQPLNRFYLLIYLFGLLLTACSGATPLPTPPAPTSTPAPAYLPPITADTLPALVLAERDASIQGNLPMLATLWAEDSRIVDGRGSVEQADDYVWAGRAAILDRYQMAVFPFPPPPLDLDELTGAPLLVEGETATLINGVDRWRFVLQDDRWWLYELVYNAPIP